MKRREILSALGMSVGGMALLGSKQAGAQEQHHHHDKLHVACLKACSDCGNVCNETFHHCFEKVKDGHKSHNRMAALALDCHEFCCLAADLIGRESEMIAMACACLRQCVREVRRRMCEARRRSNERMHAGVPGVREGLSRNGQDSRAQARYGGGELRL